VSGLLHRLTTLVGGPVRLYVVATGAGAGIQQEIWSVPGCSSFFRGASFPYAAAESEDFAGISPDKHASEDFAHDLAAAAYLRAVDPLAADEIPVGLAVTASVSSLTAHRGEHRVHVVCMTPDRVIGVTKILKKGGAEQRLLEGSFVDETALGILCDALGWNEDRHQYSLEDSARERFFKNPLFYPGGDRHPDNDYFLDPKRMLFPGAFDPPHAGHLAVSEAMEQEDGLSGSNPPVFTICSTPSHKKSLTIQEMLRRRKMLKNRTVLFTRNDPLFIDKARARPRTPFILGADALLRMLDPFWGVDPKAMLEEFVQLGTTFYVFGREVDGEFVNALNAVDKAYAVSNIASKIFVTLPGRWDISSTSLRSELAELAKSP
jgi:nicotinic acid mononucleotide adenylyltransferase